MNRRGILYAALGLGGLAALVGGWFLLPNRLFYKEGRPTRIGKATNRTMGRWAALGIPAFSMVTLEVPGRKTGRTNSTVLVLTPHEGADYLISMLGENADWVRNVRAAGGKAMLRHGRTEPVVLEEVAAELRPPILKAYLQRARGGRPHFPIGPDAPLEAFKALAAQYPVFRIVKS